MSRKILEGKINGSRPVWEAKDKWTEAVTRADRQLLGRGRRKRLGSDRKIWGRKVEEASSRNWYVMYTTVILLLLLLLLLIIIIIIIAGNCATSRKAAGSIPDGVTGTFIDTILPALGMTQPLTEMSTRNIYWGGGG